MKLDIFNRQQLLDRLHDCQNGEATCLKVMREIEAAVDRELGEFLVEKLRKVIHDEIGGYEKKHPDCEGMCEAVLARVIVTLEDEND